MQIDFAEKDVIVNGETLRGHFFIAVLGYSRRIFAKAYSAENQAAWLDGIESAFFFEASGIVVGEKQTATPVTVG